MSSDEIKNRGVDFPRFESFYTESAGLRILISLHSYFELIDENKLKHGIKSILHNLDVQAIFALRQPFQLDFVFDIDISFVGIADRIGCALGMHF